MTAANIDEREALWEMLPGIIGLLIGDKGYISAPLRAELARRGIRLETALRSNMEESRSPKSVRLLNSTRRLIETVIGQLSERFKIE